MIAVSSSLLSGATLPLNSEEEPVLFAAIPEFFVETVAEFVLFCVR